MPPALHKRRAGILFYFHKIPPLSGRAAAPKSEDFIESDKRKRGWTGVFYSVFEFSGATLHGIDPFIKYWDFWALDFIRTDKMPWRKKPALHKRAPRSEFVRRNPPLPTFSPPLGWLFGPHSARTCSNDGSSPGVALRCDHTTRRPRRTNVPPCRSAIAREMGSIGKEGKGRVTGSSLGEYGPWCTTSAQGKA